MNGLVAERSRPYERLGKWRRRRTFVRDGRGSTVSPTENINQTVLNTCIHPFPIIVGSRRRRRMRTWSLKVRRRWSVWNGRNDNNICMAPSPVPSPPPIDSWRNYAISIDPNTTRKVLHLEMVHLHFRPIQTFRTFQVSTLWSSSTIASTIGMCTWKSKQTSIQPNIQQFS